MIMFTGPLLRITATSFSFFSRWRFRIFSCSGE